ncbi:MAG: low molecular weight phosphatase family protein [Candidatus Paceibacterota bacterium]
MKTILFACTENKKRSKIAEAVFNHLAQEKNIDAHAISAGTIPAQEVDTVVAGLLNEKDIKTQLETPRKLTDELLTQADRIVSFGCLIPDMFPKDKFEEWLVDDPKTPEEYKLAFDTIYQKVEDLLQRIS